MSSPRCPVWVRAEDCMANRRMDIKTWKNAKGEPFRIVTWTKEGAEALLFIHHGLGEHAGRYQSFADGLDDLNVSIASFDARGHGESVGKKGDAPGWAGFSEDLLEIFPVIVDMVGAKKVALMGHSMGGGVVAYTLTHHGVFDDRIEAMLLSAPAVAVTLDFAGRVKAGVGRVLNKISPTMTLASPIDPAVISSDASEVRRYIEDPLIHNRISAQLGMSMLDDGPETLETAGKLGLPTLVWHGQDDGLIPIDGSRALAKKLGASDKTLHEFPGLRHETHHESPEDRAKVFGVIGNWLQERGLA